MTQSNEEFFFPVPLFLEVRCNWFTFFTGELRPRGVSLCWGSPKVQEWVRLFLTLLGFSTRRNRVKSSPEVVAAEVIAVNRFGTVIFILCARPHAICFVEVFSFDPHSNRGSWGAFVVLTLYGRKLRLSCLAQGPSSLGDPCIPLSITPCWELVYHLHGSLGSVDCGAVSPSFVCSFKT